mmetsp:Transcript_133098/g.425629  ORF Transcript_133098/g.425629 Transcript_133098/m.425629 type:complete len:437 (+) Transcript_133098:364-1674(+)
MRRAEHHHGVVRHLRPPTRLPQLVGRVHAASGVGVQAVAVQLVPRPDSLADGVLGGDAGEEVLARALELLGRDSQLARLLEALHGLGQLLRVLAEQIKQVPLEVAANADVHGRRASLFHCALVVVPGGEEAMQDVIRVCGADKMPHRQAHALGVVPGQDVTEVAGGHAEGQLAVALRAQLEVRVEVIGDLKHDACPIDGVHGSEAVLLLEVELTEESLHDVLAVVEGALDGHAMHVWVQDARHLLLLDLGNPALREQNEALHVLLAAQPIDRRTACVAAGRPNHSEPSRVPLEEVLIDVAQGLQGNVLESEGRPMEELHDVHVADLHGRHNLRVREGLIAAVQDLPKIRMRNLVRGAEERGNLEGEIRETQLAPSLVRLRHIRDLIRDHEPTIGGEALEHGLLEGQAGGTTTGAAVPDLTSHRAKKKLQKFGDGWA